MTDRSARFSRRDSARIGGVALGVLAGLHAGAGRAQADDIPDVVREFVEGWEAKDVDQILQTFAPDGVREDITSSVSFHGHDEIRQSLTTFFAAFDDASVEHPAVLAGPPPYAADTWVFNGSYAGTLPGLPAGKGQPLTIRGFTLIELVGDKIQRTTDYYDASGILRQLESGTLTF